MTGDPLKHYRTVAATTPFTVAQLEAYCAALRPQGIPGDKEIACNYQVTLSVRINEPI